MDRFPIKRTADRAGGIVDDGRRPRCRRPLRRGFLRWSTVLARGISAVALATASGSLARGDEGERPPFSVTETPTQDALAHRFEEMDLLREKLEPEEVVSRYRQLYREVLRAYGPDVYEPFAVLDKLAVFHSDRTQAAESGTLRHNPESQEDRQRNFEAMQAIRREVIEGLEKSAIVDWRKRGEIAKNAGLIHLDEGRLEEALTEMNRAAALFKEHPGAADYPYSRVLYSLAEIAAVQGRWDDAEEASDAQFRLRHRLDARSLDQLSLDALEYAEGLAAYHLAYSIARRRAELPGKAARFAEWNLNAKSFRRETFARQLAALNSSRDSEAVAVRERLHDVWGRLAGGVVEPVRGPLTQTLIDRRVDAMLGLFEELKGLAREAARVTRPLAAERNDWVSIDRVRETLPPDAVLIDVIGHLEYNFDATPGLRTWKAARNLAFVIPPAGRGEVRLVDLGDEMVIWKAVDTYVRRIGRAGGMAGDHRAAAEAERAARGVAELLIDPLMPHVRDARRWVISPYALSWLVPWSTLVLEDGSMVVERYATSYLMAGRHVLDRPRVGPASGVTPGPPLIIADPSYDLGLPASERGRGPFPPLPETVEEARAIAPYLEIYAKARPRLLLGEAARERSIREGGPPIVLVASTHGYYGQLPDAPVGAESPMLRCGLAFAGANARRAATARPGDDGVSTGLEILATDLRGTDLAVLSACESSRGEFQTSQGLIGLNLAFHLAGVRTVLGALWPVPVDETTALTTEFFAELSRGTPKDEALRRSQVKLIGQLRSESGVAHPDLWAGFLLTGDALPTRSEGDDLAESP